jgi:hypothetical protein
MALAVAVFLTIVLHRYNHHLSLVLSDMENINLNKDKIQKQIQEMDAVIEYLRKEFNINIEYVDSEKYIFQALDDIKANFRNASLTATMFEKVGGKKQLPIEIEVPVNNFRMLANYIGYIESFRIPDFKIELFSLLRKPSGKVILRIKGNLIMPSTS